MFIKYRLIYYGISCLLVIVSLLVHPIFWLFLFVYGIFVIYRLKLHNFITILIFTIIFSCLINWPKPIDEPVIKGEIINLDENSIDLSLTKEPTIFLMVILMLIGASPASTGGGIKTTTVAVLFLTDIIKQKYNEFVE